MKLKEYRMYNCNTDEWNSRNTEWLVATLLNETLKEYRMPNCNTAEWNTKGIQKI